MAHGSKVERVSRVVNIDTPVEVRKANPRPGDDNDVVVSTLIHGVSTVESRVLLSLLAQILNNVAYTELRTSRQLGYVVSAGMGQIANVLYMTCMVQGNVLGADDVDAAIEGVYSNLMPSRLQN